jgi:hypothetical protein
VSTIEELLEKEVAALVSKSEINGRGDRCAEHATPVYQQKLALTLPASDGLAICQYSLLEGYRPGSFFILLGEHEVRLDHIQVTLVEVM